MRPPRQNGIGVLSNEAELLRWLERMGFVRSMNPARQQGFIGIPPSGSAGGDLTGTYPNPNIAASAVGSAEIAVDAVGSSEIAANAVTADEIAANAVGSSEIATDAVGADEIAAGAVGSSEIATNAVGSDELADNAVDTAAIQANAVTAAKVAADVATQAELDAHSADTTSVHGIADTADLATDADVSGAVSTHSADTTSVHGITDTSALYRAGGTDVAVADGGTGASSASSARSNLDVPSNADLSGHASDTTSVHGIADTTVLATDSEVATAVSDHNADTTVHGIDTANVPSSDEKAALPGTYGSPGSANRYVTDTDPRIAAETPALFDAILALGPSLYWTLDDVTGITDQSGNGNDGTAQGGVTIGGGGSLTSDNRSSTDFDGTNDYISSSYSPFVADGTMTLFGIAQMDDLGEVGYLVAGSGGSEIQMSVRFGGDVRFGFAPGSNTTWGNAWSGDDPVVWALRVNDDSNKAELFVNGVSRGVKTISPSYGSAGNIQLGKRALSSTEQWDGRQVHFAVYPHGLSSASVAWLSGIATGETGIPAIADAKGDLLVAPEANSLDNFPAGADDTMLMYDSSQPLGVKAAAPATPSAQVDPGDSASQGTADTWARSDHQHPVSPNFVKTSGTGAESNLRVVRGIYTTIGGSASIVEGSGFSLTRNGVGDVTVDFTTDFSDVPAVTAMLGQGSVVGIVFPNTGGITASSARLIAFQTGGGGAFDSIVHFIAVGPA